MSLEAFKALVREQFNILLIDPEGALAALPPMLPPDQAMRSKAFDLIVAALSARGEMSEEDNKRLESIGRLFGVQRVGSPNLAAFQPRRSDRQARIS